jgi:hypothetical protein
MRYQRFIQPKDQPQWFESLDPRRDWYFIAYVRNEPFALFHVKAIDWTRGYGESGGFVGDAAFIGRPEPAQATLALMDLVFVLFHIQSLEAQYDSHLRRIVRFNQQIGYQVIREEADGFVRARVTAERYFACAYALRKAAATLYGTAAILTTPDPWLAPFIERANALQRADFQLQLQ